MSVQVAEPEAHLQPVDEPVFDVVWPLGRPVRPVGGFAPRLDTLEGKTVAFLWNHILRGDWAFAQLAKDLKARYPSIEIINWDVFGNTHGGNEHEVVAGLPDRLREVGADAVISGVAACGSCTPAAVRAAAPVERAGIPTVVIGKELFRPAANAVARFLDLEGLPLALHQGQWETEDHETFSRGITATVVDDVVAALTTPITRPASAGEAVFAPRETVFSGSFDAVQEHFHASGWTDGMTIAPPTVRRVEAFLAHTARPADDVIGVLLPELREVTVWNVAVTGVMAGCKPEYMPVLIAVAEAIAAREFRIEDFGCTPGIEPLIVLSGPIARELEFNSGIGVLRVGERANTSVGRFTRLLIRNFAGLRIPPGGDTDRAGIGQSFHVVLAEDEDAVAALDSAGWPTLGAERGLSDGESAVTLQSVIAVSQPLGSFHGPDDRPEQYLDEIAEQFGTSMCGYWCWTTGLFGQWHNLIVMSPQVAGLLVENGWTKQRVKQYLYERAQVPATRFESSLVDFGSSIEQAVAEGHLGPEFAASDDPERLLPAFIKPEWINIVVAGNPAMTWSRGYMNNHFMGIPTTRKVERA